MNVQEWFRFVTEHLTSEQVAGLSRIDISGRRKYVLPRIGTPSLFLGHHKRPTSSLAERLKALIREAPIFWQSHARENDRLDAQFRLLLDGTYSTHARTDLRRLGIFFDRILYTCPLHELWSLHTNQGFEVNDHNIAILALRLGGILASREIFEATKLSPVFDLVPISVDMDEIVSGAESHALRLFQSLILHVEASSFDVLKAYIQTLPNDMLSQLVRDAKLLDEITQKVHLHYDTVNVSEVICEAPDGSLHVEPMSRVKPVSWDTKYRLQNLAFLLPALVRAASGNALIAEHAAAEVLHQPALGTLLAPLQDATARAFEMAALEPPEELLIARGLLAPETGYLESGSPEALARLREDLEGVRREIRVARADLREALRRGEHEAVRLFTTRLGHTIETAKARITDMAVRRKSQRKNVLVAAAGTLSFTAASTLLPLVGIPTLAAVATAPAWPASFGVLASPMHGRNGERLIET
jgi:hypothetical protein